MGKWLLADTTDLYSALNRLQTDIPAHFIYGLVDPNTLRVRYVGHARDAQARLKAHLITARRGRGLRCAAGHAVYEWIRSLSPGKPLLVVLDVIEGTLADATKVETKWMKRFERSGLLLNSIVRTKTYRRLVNPPSTLDAS